MQAFVDFFSRGLQEEYRRQGIIIQVCVLVLSAQKLKKKKLKKEYEVNK